MIPAHSQAPLEGVDLETTSVTRLMLPRERWEAAVRLQREAQRAIDGLPIGADAVSWQPVLEVVNRATHELCDVVRTDPDVCTDEEWRVAYGIHRDALLRRGRQDRAHAIAIALDRHCTDAGELYRSARPHLDARR